MRNLKFGFTLLLTMLAFGCANQDFIEETQPAVTVDGQRGASSNETPVSATMTIGVEFPRGFDVNAFRLEHGDYFGLTLVGTCPTNPGRELWVVPYMTAQEFHLLLWDFFAYVNTVPGTQSNGNGGYQAHAKYESNNGGNQNSSNSAETINLMEIIFIYNATCS